MLNCAEFYNVLIFIIFTNFFYLNNLFLYVLHIRGFGFVSC